MTLPTPRRLLFAALTTLGAMVAAVATTELWLRENPTYDVGTALLATAPPSQRACIRASLTRGYEPIPGECGTDARGYRVQRAEGPREVSVLLLGDSVAEHAWVDTMVATAAAAADRGVTVHNAALSGYDTCRALRVFEERIFPGGDPALVLLQTCPNDLIGTPVLAHLPDGTMRYFGEEGAVEFPGWIFRSRILALVWTRRATWFTEPTRLSDNPPALSHAPLQLACLARLQREVDAAGARLSVVSFPYFQGALVLDEETRLRDGIRDAGLVPFDVRAELVRAGQTPLLTSRDGVHPDGSANRTIGALVGGWFAGEIGAGEP